MTYNLELPFRFLSKLSQNNNKPWFLENKGEYESSLAEVVSFADEVLGELLEVDHIQTETGKKSLYRIYRDVRFSKDKTPYKKNFSGGFKRATAALRGGYYFHLEPGNTFIAGGFFGPNAKDLLHIRKQLEQDASALASLVSSKSFLDSFGGLQGDKLKTCPKGFDKDDEAITLLRHKSFIVKKTFTDEEVFTPGFHKMMARSFADMLPFFEVMTEYLTTDLNGVSLV